MSPGRLTFNDPKTADLDIVVDGNIYHAHRAVVCAASGLLDRYIREHMRKLPLGTRKRVRFADLVSKSVVEEEENSGKRKDAEKQQQERRVYEIKLRGDFTSRDMRQALGFLYGDTIELGRGKHATDCCLDMYRIGRILEIPDLKKYALVKLMGRFKTDHKLNCENFIRTLQNVYDSRSRERKDALWKTMVSLGQTHAACIQERAIGYKESLREMPDFVMALALQPPQEKCVIVGEQRR